MEAEQGIEELIEAMSRSDRRAAKSQLVRLMKHIIKWKHQPDKRTVSWVTTILNARLEIREEQEENPSITDEEIKTKIWEKAFRIAVNEAAGEMGLEKLRTEELTWEEVFERHYTLAEA